MWKSSKNEKVVSKKTGNNLLNNFSTYFGGNFVNFQKNFKKLDERFGENSMLFYEHFGEFVM